MDKKYTINTKIYRKNILLESIEAFKEISDIKFIDKKIVINGDSEEEIEEVFNELMNYVISNINEQ